LAPNKLRVVSFESRRAAEIARLLERHGAECLSAPSMRELPLEATPQALELVQRLRSGRVDVMILLTGMGTRALAKAVESVAPLDEMRALLRSTAILVRGPKPTAVLKEWGVPIAMSAPEPNTWREVLSTLDTLGEIRGKQVAVQEYGIPNQRLYEGLRERGADVFAVPVYRWAPPEDVEPLRTALRRVVAGELDVAMFTSANQVYSVVQFAAGEGLEQAFRRALSSMVVASVGPVCSEALEAHDIKVNLEPSHPKMGHLVLETVERAPPLLDGIRLHIKS